MQYRNESGAIKKLLTGLMLRCPNCETGNIGEGWMGIRTYCPHCQVHFERAEGERTGAMMLDLSLMPVWSILFFIVLYSLNPDASLLILVGLPLLTLIVSMLLFYRHARGLWAAVVHLTGGLYTDAEWAQQQADAEASRQQRRR